MTARSLGRRRSWDTVPFSKHHGGFPAGATKYPIQADDPETSVAGRARHAVHSGEDEEGALFSPFDRISSEHVAFCRGFQFGKRHQSGERLDGEDFHPADAGKIRSTADVNAMNRQRHGRRTRDKSEPIKSLSDMAAALKRHYRKQATRETNHGR